jgi:hypothetical protein
MDGEKGASDQSSVRSKEGEKKEIAK